ncbi:MAG: hypothetical protein EON95_00400 [Caulobacteraceae bacterium]|nr:hypothetical protein [Caulobacter sp.]RYF95722.1 MAG: hypothetical protein EON95_00400 [Caulobacteraceae bacterium]
MRLLFSVVVIILALLALPATAEAAKTPCGFLNGQYDIAGRTYSAEVVWPQRTLKGLVTLNANCSAMLSLTGQASVMGAWTQKDGRMSMKFVGLDFLGNVAADGAVSGQMVNSIDDVGAFRLTAPDGGRAPRSPPIPAPAPAPGGRCGNRALDNSRFQGPVVWPGETVTVTVSLRPDCSATFLGPDGKALPGEWIEEDGVAYIRFNNGQFMLQGPWKGDRLAGEYLLNNAWGRFNLKRQP